MAALGRFAQPSAVGVRINEHGPFGVLLPRSIGVERKRIVQNAWTLTQWRYTAE